MKRATKYLGFSNQRWFEIRKVRFISSNQGWKQTASSHLSWRSWRGGYILSNEPLPALKFHLEKQKAVTFFWESDAAISWIRWALLMWPGPLICILLNCTKAEQCEAFKCFLHLRKMSSARGSSCDGLQPENRFKRVVREVWIEKLNEIKHRTCCVILYMSC